MSPHKEARQIAQRFIDGHFRNVRQDGSKNWPRISIPADPQRDDDLRLMAYIDQQERMQAELVALLKAARKKLQIECGGVRDYQGGVPTQVLFPMIDAALSKAELREGEDGTVTT